VSLDLHRAVRDTFGVDQLGHGLFVEFDVALRFDLGGEISARKLPIRRFRQALARATQIAALAFEQSSSVSVLVMRYGSAKPRRGRLKPFKQCGLRRGDFLAGASIIHDVDEGVFRHFDMAPLVDKSAIGDLIWLALAGEMPIKPDAGDASIYLVDFTRRIIVHPYDDRGLDVVAMDREMIQPLFDRFGDWLLPHDLSRMKDMFGPRS
jgi:hypothetical protein